MTKSEKSKIARALSAMRKTHAGGRRKVMRKCKYCGCRMGTAELRAHKCEEKETATTLGCDVARF